MIVIDTSALIGILRGEPEAETFLKIIRDADGCLMTPLGVMEASLVLAGRTRSEEAWSDLDALIARAEIEVVPLDRALASLGRDAFLRFGKGRHPAALNMGDCASYALAKARNLPLLFKGYDLPRTDLARAA